MIRYHRIANSGAYSGSSNSAFNDGVDVIKPLVHRRTAKRNLRCTKLHRLTLNGVGIGAKLTSVTMLGIDGLLDNDELAKRREGALTNPDTKVSGASMLVSAWRWSIDGRPIAFRTIRH